MKEGQLLLESAKLDDYSDKAAKTLVGKLMKRFEIIDDKEVLKKECKELVYEGFRYLNDMLKAYGTGQHFQWTFDRPSK